MHEGEEDDDWTVGIDVAGAIPDHISPRCFRLDGDGELPDGGHGLDAEEQGRGEVEDPSDTLEQKTKWERKRATFYLLGLKLIFSGLPFRAVLVKVLGPALASILGHLKFKIIFCSTYLD